MAMDLQKLGLLMSGIASTTSRNPNYLQTNLVMQDAFQEMKDRERMEAEKRQQDQLLMRLMSPQIGTPATKSFQVNGRTIGRDAPAQMTSAGPDQQLRELGQLPGFREAAIQKLLAQKFPEKPKTMALGDNQRLVTEEGKTVIEALPKEEALPDVARRAIEAGHVPGSQSYQDFITAATMRPPTQVNIGNEETYLGSLARALPAAQLKQYETAMARAQTAASTKAQTQQFKSALDSGRFTTGFASGPRQAIAEAAVLFGMDPSAIPLVGDPAMAETMDSASNVLALDLVSDIEGLRGTNLALRIAKDTVANLSRTPAGNRLILDLKERLADLAIAEAKIYEEAVNSPQPDLRPVNGKIRELRANFDRDSKPIVDRMISEAKDAPKSWNDILGRQEAPQITDADRAEILAQFPDAQFDESGAFVIKDGQKRRIGR